jgi:uncharacterized protein with HEPN domain
VREPLLRVRDILEAIESIAAFVRGMDAPAFKDDDKTSSAVVHKLEIIGEAAKAVPESVRMQTPEVPWREMSGMRDRLIHSYFGIDFDLVWHTIKDRLPAVRAALLELLSSEQAAAARKEDRPRES